MGRAMAPYEYVQRSVGALQAFQDGLTEELGFKKNAQAAVKRDSAEIDFFVGDDDNDGTDDGTDDGVDGIDDGNFDYDNDSSAALPSSTTSLPLATQMAILSSTPTSNPTSISSTSSAISSTSLAISSTSSAISSTPSAISSTSSAIPSTSSAIASKTVSIVETAIPISTIDKGLYTDDSSSSSTMPLVQVGTSASSPSQIISSSASALGDATSTAAAPLITSSDTSSHPALSPPAQNVLIAAAIIAGFVFLGAVLYFILRFMNISVKSYINKFTRRRPASWRPGPYGGLGSDTPPYATFPGEKPLPITRKLHTPIVIPSAAIAQALSVQELAQANTERQDLVRQALQEDPRPFLADPDPFEDGPPAYEFPASYPRQTPQPPRRPSTAYGPDRHTSYLSSLSSGFGDLKIDIPESGPTKPQNALRKQSITDRISRNNFQSRFSHSSWISNPSTPARSRANSRSNRDTIYTAVSEESTPRFRTVNSWVSQQARRAQRQQDVDREIDNMPEIPSQNVLAGGVATNHQRQPSEATESIFGFHPGDQVPIAKGKRVSSKILDRIL